jgi:hypothetical protein
MMAKFPFSMSIRALIRALSELAGKIGADTEIELVIDKEPREITAISEAYGKARIYSTFPLTLEQ